MPSSTSSSEPSASDSTPFVGGALAFLGALFVLVVMGSSPGWLYRPTPLALTDAELAQHGQYVVLFGNSRIDAGIDPRQLSAELGVGCQPYLGGGWHSLHYEQLALLNAPRLRPGKDVVVIDVNVMSMDQGQMDRLSVIRPETAVRLASLPEVPFEKRLDMLFGAINPIYRYRLTVQSRIQDRLSSFATRLAERLPHTAAPWSPPFRLITDTERNWVMNRIEGDKQAFLSENRKQIEPLMPRAAVGASHRAALTQGVEVLRRAGIDVVLLEIPVSSWLVSRFPPAFVDEHHRWLDALAARSGATVLRDWPSEMYDDDRYYDVSHLYSGSTSRFTHLVAEGLRARYPQLFPPRP